MNSPSISYIAGAKYELTMDCYAKLDLPTVTGEPHYSADILYVDGMMTLRAWAFTWDGLSGPALDTRLAMRAGAFHDGGYRLIRRGVLAPEYKDAIDELFRNTYKEDVALHGNWLQRRVGSLRDDWLFAGVHIFGGGSIQPGAERKILVAP